MRPRPYVFLLLPLTGVIVQSYMHLRAIDRDSQDINLKKMNEGVIRYPLSVVCVDTQVFTKTPSVFGNLISLHTCLIKNTPKSLKIKYLPPQSHAKGDMLTTLLDIFRADVTQMKSTDVTQNFPRKSVFFFCVTSA